MFDFIFGDSLKFTPSRKFRLLFLTCAIQFGCLIFRRSSRCHRQLFLLNVIQFLFFPKVITAKDLLCQPVEQDVFGVIICKMMFVSGKNKNVLFPFQKHHFGAVNLAGENVTGDFHDFFDKQQENMSAIFVSPCAFRWLIRQSLRPSYRENLRNS